MSSELSESLRGSPNDFALSLGSSLLRVRAFFPLPIPKKSSPSDDLINDLGDGSSITSKIS